MGILKKTIIVLGAALGVYAGNRMMLFAFAWDDSVEKCCLDALPQLLAIVSKVSLLPLVGAVFGALITWSLFGIVCKLKSALQK
ncbi:MAG: hypothetical protein V4735_05555 [Pseudomonadota bacterium]